MSEEAATPNAASAEDEEEDLFKADDEEDDSSKQKPPTEKSDETTTTQQPKVEATASTEDSTTKQNGSSDEPAEAKPTVLSPDAPIPRVSAPAPATTQTAASPSSSSPGLKSANKYGLPPDIEIPASITPALLNGRLLETLRGLPKQLISDALAEYDDAVQIKGESIRNHGAYLYGVVKRYVSVQERASSGEGEGVLPMGPDLTPAVNERLAKLVSDGFCTQDEMNEKVKSKIRMLSEKDALFAIEELASVDRSQIRNFGSYFMGILNRYMRGERKDVTSGKKTIAEVRQSFQQQHQSSNRRDDRFQRGRDNEPQYRRARDDSNNRRERSRDRFDMSGRSNDFQNQYDTRNPQQQRPPYHGQPPMGGNPPPPPPHPPGMPGGANLYQQAQPPSLYGQNLAPQMQPPYGQQPPPSHMTQPPNQQYSPHPMGGPPSGNPYGDQNTPQRGPAYVGQPPPYGQQQQFVSQQQAPYINSQQQGGIPGLPPMQGAPSANSYGMPNQQPPSYMNQQQQQPPQQQSYANSPFASPAAPVPNRYNQQPGGPPDRWGNQSAPASAVDILALADKASSAVQALQNQSKFAMRPAPGALSMQQPSPSPYQTGAPLQPYGQPAMSIPQSYPPPMNQPYHPQHQAPPQDYGAGAQKRRRTTASIADLPITVQYAVQNLQATGQIDGPLDDGMLGMVKDLPENLALQALQKFATIDKSTMRNKTAYLAGVLRRELEKIHRR